MKMNIVNLEGQEVGSLTASAGVWNADQNTPLLHQVIVAQLANRRQGTHSTLRRGEVNCSGRKLRQQKRSGRARLGSRGAPTLVGGGVAHGPHPRSYRQVIPHKMRLGALRIALSSKRRDKQLTVVDKLVMEDTRVKPVKAMLNALGLDRRVLVVTAENSPQVVRSVANLQNVSVTAANLLNPLETMRAQHLVFTSDAVKVVDKLWGVTASSAGKGK